MKRIVISALCVCLLFGASLVPTAALSDVGVLTLPEDDGSVYPVTGFTSDAYRGDESITRLVVPENILLLGERAFENCSRLEEIILHDNLQALGEHAFSHTAYYDNPLNWEDGVLYVGNALIKANPALVAGTYTVRPGTRIIADGAFRDCASLTAISLPQSVAYVGVDAFAGTAWMENTGNWVDGVLTAGHVLVAVRPDRTGAFAVAEGISTIADGAFANSQIAALTTPVTLKHIGYNAFTNCKELQSVDLAQGVETLGRGPFRGCDKLAVLSVHADNAYFTAVDNVLYDKAMSAVVKCPPQQTSSYAVLPATIQRIDAFAFEGCANLAYVFLSTDCVFIGESAFADCTKLADITLPEVMEYISHHAFARCSSLTAITVPDKVWYVGTYAFSACTALTEATIGHGVTVLEEGLFADAAQLTDVHIGNGVEVIRAGAFTNTACVTHGENYTNGLLIVSDRYVIRAAATIRDCILPYGVTVVADDAFETMEENVWLRAVHLPTTLQRIQREAFGDIPAQVPVYYSGSLAAFNSAANFHRDNLNLFTVDLTTAKRVVFLLFGSLLIVSVGFVVAHHVRQKQTTRVEEECENDE